MELVCILGKMVDIIWVNIKMIRNMATAFTNGPMAESTSDNG